jgi:hypothetical protein
VEGKSGVDALFLQNNLKTLYTGLVNRNILPRKIPLEKVFPVVVKINNVKTEPGDIKTFKGTVNMLDYITQLPMILNVIVHQKNCTDTKHSYLLFEVSPKPFNHPNWEKLNKLNTDFSCTH